MAYNPHPSQKTLRMGHPKTRFAELSLRQGKQGWGKWLVDGEDDVVGRVAICGGVVGDGLRDGAALDVELERLLGEVGKSSEAGLPVAVCADRQIGFAHVHEAVAEQDFDFGVIDGLARAVLDGEIRAAASDSAVNRVNSRWICRGGRAANRQKSDGADYLQGPNSRHYYSHYCHRLLAAFLHEKHTPLEGRLQLCVKRNLMNARNGALRRGGSLREFAMLSSSNVNYLSRMAAESWVCI